MPAMFYWSDSMCGMTPGCWETATHENEHGTIGCEQGACLDGTGTRCNIGQIRLTSFIVMWVLGALVLEPMWSLTWLGVVWLAFHTYMLIDPPYWIIKHISLKGQPCKLFTDFTTCWEEVNSSWYWDTWVNYSLSDSVLWPLHLHSHEWLKVHPNALSPKYLYRLCCHRWLPKTHYYSSSLQEFWHKGNILDATNSWFS